MDGVLLKMSVHRLSPKILAIGGSVEEKKQQMSNGSMPLNQKTTSYWISRLPFEFLRIGKGKKMIGPVKNESDAVLLEKRKIEPEKDESDDVSLEKPVSDSDVVSEPKVNWVMRILEVGSIWKGKRQRSGGGEEEEEETKIEFCTVDDEENEEEEEVRFDREQFSSLLKKVSLVDIQMFAKLSFLGNLAYSIPEIRSKNLLRNQGLRFVTSSIDQRIVSSENEEEKVNNNGDQKKIINPAVAYRIAASAASRLFSQSKAVLPFTFSKGQDTSLLATADSVTAVVAAEEDVKQAVADDLKSTKSPPCEWFICDDDRTGTRFFFIQGSESLASWQANLLFEPVPFEELDVPVHRGIYEAAKGIYEQMLPEVQAHLKSRGENRSFLRFSGHSLGGSLSLLVSLMLLIRGEVPVSCLLPVITFGSPCIMCGGDKLLQKLGLPKSFSIAISMHRDIVPRAFSCTYPNSAAKLLKALNGNFRNHSCLNKQKFLYSATGQLLILQPSEKISPPHPLLPPGSGLYMLTSTDESEKELRAAKTAFFNSPHPLEILSDRYAYGSTGKIKRDHDMSSYLRALRYVIRKELKHRKSEKNLQVKFFLVHILCTGRDSLKLVTRFVASRSSQLVIIFFLPVRLLVTSVFGVIFHHSQAHSSLFK